MEREDLLGNVRRNEAIFDEVMEGLRDLPFVGDVRGCGYFRVVELVKDKATKQSFTDDECNWLLRDELSPYIYNAGLICRADDRADPVLVLSPTLVCGEEELRFIGKVLTDALNQAAIAFSQR
jgi:adenosylmethionine-8-amino-7-oxononanoate aminotransferase